MRPFFSIITPTHLRPQLLARCLQSIRKQNCKLPFECIVVSDAVDPATDAVCTSMLGPMDTFVRRSGKPGPALSRNLALDLTRGEYVMFLDDDDAWHPGLLQALVSSPLVQTGRFVYFNATVVYERRLVSGPIETERADVDFKDQLNPLVYIRNQVHFSCYAFPKRLIETLRFDPSLRAYEDWDFLLGVIGREAPQHLPILGSLIHEVSDETTDRRGNSALAEGISGAVDYLYVYRKHPAPSEELKKIRAEFLKAYAFEMDPSVL